MLRRLLPKSCSRMRIFLSYAREDFAIAERIAQALRNDGHTLFFDKHDLAAGDDYDGRIRDSIAASDRFVFLLSRNSVDPGSYTLTELRFARERWPAARGAVLPVIIDKTLDLKDLPAYLTSVHIFQPEGNIPAETANQVAKSATVNRVCKTCAGVASAAVFAAAVFFAATALGPSLKPVDVALLPIESVQFRPRAEPPDDPSKPGAPNWWTNSPTTLTVITVAYAHRTDGGKRARVLHERIEMTLGGKVYKADWAYFVDLKVSPRCATGWLCVQANSGPETLEPGRASKPRETMFLFPPDQQIKWADFFDNLLTTNEKTLRIVMRSKLEIPKRAQILVEEREAVCDVDLQEPRARLLKNYKPGADPRMTFWQPRCIQTAIAPK